MDNNKEYSSSNDIDDISYNSNSSHNSENYKLNEFSNSTDSNRSLDCNNLLNMGTSILEIDNTINNYSEIYITENLDKNTIIDNIENTEKSKDNENNEYFEKNKNAEIKIDNYDIITEVDTVNTDSDIIIYSDDSTSIELSEVKEYEYEDEYIDNQIRNDTFNIMTDLFEELGMFKKDKSFNIQDITKLIENLEKKNN